MNDTKRDDRWHRPVAGHASTTHGPCFCCGDENPGGMGAHFFVQEDGTVTSDFTFTLHEQGPPRHAHGGSLATILDEAMGNAAWLVGTALVAVNLSLQYRRPVPIGTQVHVEARVVRSSGRKHFTEGRILLPDGAVAVEATGLFVEAKHLFAGASGA